MNDILRKSGRLVSRTMPNGETVELIEKGAIFSGFNPDTREVIITASSGAVDRMGDVIDPNGWDLRHFEKNPVVLLDHDYRVEKIAGRVVDSWVDGEKFMQRIRLDDPSWNKAAELVAKRLESGSLRAVSVGFRPVEWEPIKSEDGKPTGGLKFKRQEQLELSWVAVPANQEAVLGIEAEESPERTSDGSDLLAALESEIRAGVEAARVQYAIRTSR